MIEVNRLRQSDGPRRAIFFRSAPAGNRDFSVRWESVGRNLAACVGWVASDTLDAVPGKYQGEYDGEGDGNRFKYQS